jgi:microcystin degradation protein MlrC
MATVVAAATPGGPVDRATYDAIKADFLKRLAALLPLDGLYLPMHGAMFVEGMQDAEGDWMESARKVVGARCLLSASYDLHGNVSQRVMDNIDLFSAFRTAPHIDREETMQRACNMLVHCLQGNIRPTLVWAPIPVLMPGERSSTEWQPGKRLWAQLPRLNEQPGILDVSLLVGYVWADEPRATACAVVTGTAPAAQEKMAISLAQQYWDARKGVSIRYGDRHDQWVHRARYGDDDSSRHPGRLRRRSYGYLCPIVDGHDSVVTNDYCFDMCGSSCSVDDTSAGDRRCDLPLSDECRTEEKHWNGTKGLVRCWSGWRTPVVMTCFS